MYSLVSPKVKSNPMLTCPYLMIPLTQHAWDIRTDSTPSVTLEGPLATYMNQYTLFIFGGYLSTNIELSTSG